MSDVSRAYRSRCGRHTAVLLPSALTLMMLMLAIASRADALVYWSNSPAFAGPGSIGRASLDGTDVDQAFIHSADLLGDPAVDGSHIYWVKVVSPRLVAIHSRIRSATTTAGSLAATSMAPISTQAFYLPGSTPPVWR